MKGAWFLLFAACAALVSASHPEPQERSWEGFKEGSWVELKIESTYDGKPLNSMTYTSKFVRKERLKVGAQDVECIVIEMKGESDHLGQKAPYEAKFWYSVEVPGGIVRSESGQHGSKTITTCTGFESKK